MPERRLDLLTGFQERLSEAAGAALAAVLEAARAHGMPVYLVGGPVRDLALGRPSVDIDVAVEGDAAALAGSAAAATGARVVSHGRFGTASIRGRGFELDLARTRRETYARPGALPQVEPAGIDEDLGRRDFSVASMALRLSSPAGELLDPHGGMADIARRQIRVLHDRSFQDDATRMLRAARYAARLGFQIEDGTAALLRRDLTYVDFVSGPRLRRELALIFGEALAPAAAALAGSLGVLRSVHPLLAAPPPAELARWREALAGPRPAPLDELGFAMLSAAIDPEGVAALSSRLHLQGRLESALQDLVRLRGHSDKLNQPRLAVPAAVEMLQHLSPAAVWAFGLRTRGAASERALMYLREWRHVRPALKGSDLAALGLREGPKTGEALRRLREARLLGMVSSEADEVALVRREFPGG